MSGIAVASVVGAGGVVISLVAPATRSVPATRPAQASTKVSTPGPPTTATPTLPPPGPGFVPGRITAVGDSVMLDYQGPLESDVPGIDVDAAVSRQWDAGASLLVSLKAAGQLGGQIVIGLGTNGPITDADFDAMMTSLAGASLVLFVNVHVDRPWQDANNAVLSRGATRYPNVEVVDWNALATQNPEWLGTDGTHLPIDGAGAKALAFLVAATLASP